MMLQRTLIRRQAERVARHPSASRSPYEVLGVSPNTPFADVKKRYRELARQHHPDMPTGSEHAFREVTAAFHILRAGGATRSAAAANHKQSHQRPANSAYRRQHEASEEELKREGTREQHNYNRNQWFALDTLWRSDGLEMLIGVLGVVVLGTWTADVTFFSRRRAGYKVRSLDNLSNAQQQPAQRFQPTPMDGDGSSESRPHPPRSAGGPAAVPLVESLRGCRNQQFGTAKEFLYAYDLEGADVRSVTVSKFPVALVEEGSILTQCPHHRTFNSDVPSQAFATPEFVDALVDDLAATPWANADAAAASVLMANALSCVTVMAPSTVKWSVVEYRALDEDAGAFAKRRGHVGTTECLFAIKNNKFNDVAATSSGAARQAMMQRIVVSGSASIRYPNLTARGCAGDAKAHGGAEAEPQHGGVVRGGVVRMRDVAPFQKQS